MGKFRRGGEIGDASSTGAIGGLTIGGGVRERGSSIAPVGGERGLCTSIELDP